MESVFGSRVNLELVVLAVQFQSLFKFSHILKLRMIIDLRVKPE